MNFTEADVQAALKQLTDPNTKKDFVSGKSVKNIKISGNDVSLDIQLGYPAKSVWDETRVMVENHLRASLPGVSKVAANVTSKVIPHAVQRGVALVDGVKNIIAVASGKGGVGKSTTAVNLALALAAEGARVGILDADIYGPSQPMMLGLPAGTRPDVRDNAWFLPVLAHNIEAMSIGFLLDADNTPVVWRGPKATGALLQLLQQTLWSDLDFLIIDMPPGTGDIQLTLAQKVPVAGAVIVTTPQDIALLDARKGIEMFRKVEIPVLGVVENMALHICSNCGHAEHVFGQGGGERIARDYQTELLGALPLDLRIREQADRGQPSVIADPEGDIAVLYRGIARRMGAAVAKAARLDAKKVPNIVFE